MVVEVVVEAQVLHQYQHQPQHRPQHPPQHQPQHPPQHPPRLQYLVLMYVFQENATILFRFLELIRNQHQVVMLLQVLKQYMHIHLMELMMVLAHIRDQVGHMLLQTRM
ncbi:MAG: hypothetical protein CMQ82_03230 [Gammaproteobacteria bacterium]|nr:hypothetical protein [Gammaproteobacteria bacterium]